MERDFNTELEFIIALEHALAKANKLWITQGEIKPRSEFDQVAAMIERLGEHPEEEERELREKRKRCQRAYARMRKKNKKRKDI